MNDTTTTKTYSKYQTTTHTINNQSITTRINNTNVHDSSNINAETESINTANQKTYSKTLPHHIDIKKIADDGFAWRGLITADDMSRIADSVHQMSDAPIELSVTITKNNDIIWFSFDIVCSCLVICQRCLKPMPQAFDTITKLALLTDDSQETLLDDDQEWLLLADVSDVVGKELRLTLMDVIEDELLLNMPLAPKHEIGHSDCVPVEQINEEEEDDEEKDNPFAALAALKGQL